MIYSQDTKYSPEAEKQIDEFRVVLLTYLKDPLISHAGMYVGDIYDEIYNAIRSEVHDIEHGM